MGFKRGVKRKNQQKRKVNKRIIKEFHLSDYPIFNNLM